MKKLFAAFAMVMMVLNGFTQKQHYMKHTIVLVHGAWMDSSAWYKVKSELETKGFEVIAVNLPAHGKDTTPYEQVQLQSYVDVVRNALGSKQVILVGHSMAGIVISQVAEQIPLQIEKLVYIAAYLPQNGESLYQLSQEDKDSHVGKYWRQDDPQHYSPAFIAKEGIQEVFAADAPQEDVARLIETHKADALAPMVTPVTLTANNFGRVKKVYIYTKQDNAVSYVLQQLMTSKTKVNEGYTMHTSHSPFFSKPKELAELIVKD